VSGVFIASNLVPNPPKDRREKYVKERGQDLVHFDPDR
jgi:hypothetical protein